MTTATQNPIVPSVKIGNYTPRRYYLARYGEDRDNLLGEKFENPRHPDTAELAAMLAATAAQNGLTSEYWITQSLVEGYFGLAIPNTAVIVAASFVDARGNRKPYGLVNAQQIPGLPSLPLVWQINRGQRAYGTWANDVDRFNDGMQEHIRKTLERQQAAADKAAGQTVQPQAPAVNGNGHPAHSPGQTAATFWQTVKNDGSVRPQKHGSLETAINRAVKLNSLTVIGSDGSRYVRPDCKNETFTAAVVGNGQTPAAPQAPAVADTPAPVSMEDQIKAAVDAAMADKDSQIARQQEQIQQLLAMQNPAVAAAMADKAAELCKGVTINAKGQPCERCSNPTMEIHRNDITGPDGLTHAESVCPTCCIVDHK